MEIERAKEIAHVAQTIINTASVEIKAMNSFSESTYSSDFFGAVPPARPALNAAPAPEPVRPAPSSSRESHGHQELSRAKQVVDPLAQVKPAPPDPDERPRARANGHT